MCIPTCFYVYLQIWHIDCIGSKPANSLFTSRKWPRGWIIWTFFWLRTVIHKVLIINCLKIAEQAARPSPKLGQRPSCQPIVTLDSRRENWKMLQEKTLLPCEKRLLWCKILSDRVNFFYFLRSVYPLLRYIDVYFINMRLKSPWFWQPGEWPLSLLIRWKFELKKRQRTQWNIGVLAKTMVYICQMKLSHDIGTMFW